MWIQDNKFEFESTFRYLLGLDDVSIHLLMLSGTKSAYNVYNVHVKMKYEYITHLDKHCSSKVIMNISINKNRSA